MFSNSLDSILRLSPSINRKIFPTPVHTKMAIGSNPPTIEIDQYNGRLTSFVLLTCIVATMGGVILGYDVGISGGVASMEPFLERFFPKILARMKMETDEATGDYCMSENYILTVFRSSTYVTGMFAALAAAPVTRKHGRRVAMMITGATSLVGAAMGGGAACVSMLILGRLLVGVGVGFANQVIPIYLSEMAPPTRRGALSISFRLSQNIGFILANLIGFVANKAERHHGWRLSLALAAIPASLLTLGAAFLPETPTSLTQRGHLQHAIGLLQRIRGTSEILTELNDIVTASCTDENSAAFGRSYQTIGRRRYIHQFLMALSISFYSRVAGLSAVLFYAKVLLTRIGFEDCATLLSTVVPGIIGSCANITTAVLVDQLGRRTLFMIGGAQMILSQLMIGGAIAGKLDGRYVYFVLVMICVFVVGFECSWGPMEWLVPSEIFPLEIRSTGQSVVVAVNFLLAAVVTQTFLRMLCGFRVGMFFFLAMWGGVMTTFIWLLLPETAIVPIEQMEVVWKDHWFWRKMIANDGLHAGTEPRS